MYKSTERVCGNATEISIRCIGINYVLNYANVGVFTRSFKINRDLRDQLFKKRDLMNFKGPAAQNLLKYFFLNKTPYQMSRM